MTRGITFAPLVTALTAAATATAVAAGPSVDRPIVVTVHVVNAAQIRARDLAEAERAAASIFDFAGIPTVWLRADTNPAPMPEGVRTVHVVLVFAGLAATDEVCERAHHSDDVMGVAMATTADHDAIAYVFYDRILREGFRRGFVITPFLGQVIAHELGHVLLPGHGHSDFGIMRPRLSWRSRTIEQFTPDQAAMIRERITMVAAAR